jgi:hypothetical protein
MIKKLYWIAFIATALAIVVSALSIWVPTPEGQVWINFHGSLLASFSMAIVHLGAVAIFMLGLRGYTPRFRAAYIMLSACVATLAVAYLQIPVIGIANMLTSPWITYGGVVIPFIAAIVLTYLGIRGFARLIGVKSRLGSVWLVMGVSIAGGIVGSFLPHGESAGGTAQQAQLLIGIEVSVTLLVAFATLLAYITRKHAGVSYMPSLAWLTLYLFLSTLVNFAYVVAIFIKPDHNWVIDTNLIFMPYFFNGLVLMRTAIEFNKVRAVDADPVPLANAFTFFGKPKGQVDAQSQTPIDVILYMSTLVSNVAAIDPILDDIRIVTAKMRSPASGVGAALDASQLQSLASVYRKLESYLVEQEQVRVFTKDTLRESVKAQFASSLAAYPQFWQYVEGANASVPAPFTEARHEG